MGKWCFYNSLRPIGHLPLTALRAEGGFRFTVFASLSNEVAAEGGVTTERSSVL